MKTGMSNLRNFLRNIRALFIRDIHRDLLKIQDDSSEARRQLDIFKKTYSEDIRKFIADSQKIQTNFTKITDAKSALDNFIKEVTLLKTENDSLKKEIDFLLTTTIGRDEWLTRSRNLYKGKRCFLIGTGPSLNSTDLTKIRDEYTMGVNGTCLIDDLNLNYFISVSHIFWKHHIEEIKNVKCERRFLPSFFKESLDSHASTSWLRVIEDKNYKRVSEDKPWFFSTEADRYVCLGGSVICVGLQILYLMGFDTVILLGVDHDYGISKHQLSQKGAFFDSKDVHAHFSDKYYKDGGNVHIDIYGAERSYALAEEAFRNDGRKILNATPGTKLDIFEKVEYKSLF